jgi:orotate phosphoribosyltransferase
VELVVSPALGGVIIGHEVGRALGVRAIFTEREQGVMRLRRGFQIREGEPVLVVEDVVTTGKSTLEAAAAVTAAGGRASVFASIVDRSGVASLPLPLAAAIAGRTYCRMTAALPRGSPHRWSRDRSAGTPGGK